MNHQDQKLNEGSYYSYIIHLIPIGIIGYILTYFAFNSWLKFGLLTISSYLLSYVLVLGFLRTQKLILKQ